jgi:hypothetical protein
MMRHRLHLIVALLFVVNCSSAFAQSDLLSQTIAHASLWGDLANVLAQVAHSGRIPMVAELAQPLPDIKVPGGSHTGRHLLDLIARQAPGYTWELKGPVVHFYNRRLSQAKFNFLNPQFRQFSMPRNVSELKLWFPTLEVGLLNGRDTSGAAISSFPNPELEKSRLRPEGLIKVTGREILIRAATECPTFFTVIVFPGAVPKTAKEVEQTNLNWYWWSFNEELRHMYIQHPHRDRR